MTTPVVWDYTQPLSHVQAQLRELIDDGTRCPCCAQMAKVYRRTIHAKMARELIQCYREAGTAWFHMPSIIGHTGDLAKARYWNLMREDTTELREDGGRAGWWQITPTGEAFINHQVSVPKYARIYDGRKLSLEGPPVTIVDSLGKKFNYRELMDA
jgi:hypothetical protein